MNYIYIMDVKQTKCYNKELNKFMSFNSHIVDERFIKSTGYEPVDEPQETPILNEGKIPTLTTEYAGLPDPTVKTECKADLLCDEVKKKRGRKKQ